MATCILKGQVPYWLLFEYLCYIVIVTGWNKTQVHSVCDIRERFIISRNVPPFGMLSALLSCVGHWLCKKIWKLFLLKNIKRAMSFKWYQVEKLWRRQLCTKNNSNKILASKLTGAFVLSLWDLTYLYLAQTSQSAAHQRLLLYEFCTCQPQPTHWLLTSTLHLECNVVALQSRMEKINLVFQNTFG